LDNDSSSGEGENFMDENEFEPRARSASSTLGRTLPALDGHGL
jgi:hypothetical protein